MIVLVDSYGNCYPTDAIEWAGFSVVALAGCRGLVGGPAVTDMIERTCTALKEGTVSNYITRFVTRDKQRTVTRYWTITRANPQATVTDEHTVTVIKRRPTATRELTRTTRQYMTRVRGTGTGFVTRDVTATVTKDVTRNVTRLKNTATNELTHWQTQQTQWLTLCGVTRVVTA